MLQSEGTGDLRPWRRVTAAMLLGAAVLTAGGVGGCRVEVSHGSTEPHDDETEDPTDGPDPAPGLDAAAPDAVANGGADAAPPPPLPSKEDDPGPPPPGLVVRVTGNPGWVVRPTRTTTLIAGGGGDQDDAMRLLVERGGKGDVVVLRMNQPGEGYGPYLVGLGADSVHEIVFDATNGNDNVSGKALADLRALASSAYVERAVRNAEVVFLAGGNQTKYLDVWTGTALESALRWAVGVKHVAVGGTSAGMHVLGGITYAPGEGGSVLSADALRDPYIAEGEVAGSSALTLRKSTLAVPTLTSFVFDTHMSERNRLGRALVFLARSLQDGLVARGAASLVACDEGTAVVIDEDGKARVFGATDKGRSDYAFFVRPTGLPERCADGMPLQWASGLSVLRLPGTTDGAASIDLRTWQTTAARAQTLTVTDGVLTPDVQTPEAAGLAR